MFKHFKNIYILTSVLYLIASLSFFTSQSCVGKLGGILFFITFLFNVRLALKKSHTIH